MLSTINTVRSFTKKGADFINPNDRIFQNLYNDFGNDLKSCQTRGDWQNTDQILKNGRDWIINEITSSELRGRGGAGFSTGKKWSFVPKHTKKPHYLIINADEGEPGTCKDRPLLSNEPQKIIEGALIAAYATQAHIGYIYIRGEYKYEIECMQKAIDEAYASGLIGKNNMFNWPFDFTIFRGGGAYVCGEETGLITSMQGVPGRPRFKPPFPAVAGFFACPTSINNVESIASVPSICKRGGKWYSSLGLPGSRGTKIYSVSGCVKNPCIFEEQMGVSLRDIIEKYAGGVNGGWDNLSAVIPGGTSCAILNPKEAGEAIMSFDNLASYGSAFGTGGIVVIDKSIDIIKFFAHLSAFYESESCGQCKHCTFGTEQIHLILKRIADGNGEKNDLEKLEKAIIDTPKENLCALPFGATEPIKGLLKNFRTEIEKRIK